MTINRSRLNQSVGEVQQLLSEVARSLRFYADAGYTGGDCRKENLDSIRSWCHPNCLRLQAVPSEQSFCEGCPLQASGAHAVNGAGPPKARLIFVLGYPSIPAEREKSPYAGASGQLLTRMISAMNLMPDDIYVSHIVRCRPPDGRAPSDLETRRCINFLVQDIGAIAPKVICTFGELATRSLLSGNASLERMRGRFQERDGIRIMPTWHPDDMLEDPGKKRPVWEDMQKVMHFLDIT